MKVPGQVSWLSGHHRILSLPILRGQNSGRPSDDGLKGCGSPITVAGPRPILTAFPFSPLCKRGTAGTGVVKRPATQWKLALGEQRCQWGLIPAVEEEVGGYRDARHDRVSSPSARGCLFSPGRACTLQISCATGRAAIRGTEVANDKAATTHAGRCTQRASRPSARSG